MADKHISSSIAIITSQIEAASSLLKFATDDLNELVDSHRSIFHMELKAVIEALQLQCASLDGNAAFLARLDLVEEDRMDSDACDSSGWRGEAQL